MEDQTLSAISDSPASSGGVKSGSTAKRRRSGSFQSLMSRADSFVSFDENGEDEVESQIRENSKLRNDLRELQGKVGQIALQSECFQKDASILVKQVSESLQISDDSRAKNGSVTAYQQTQMELLLVQTQNIITQRQTTNDEMKQQQYVLNSEFAKLDERRNKVEGELRTSMGTQEVIDQKANRVHGKTQSSMGVLREESYANLDEIREELSELGKYNRNRTVHGANQPLFGGVKTESPEGMCKNGPDSIYREAGAPHLPSALASEKVSEQTKNESHAPTQHERHAPTLSRPNTEFTGQNSRPGNYFGQFTYPPQANPNGMKNSQWLIPNCMIGACPVFTANFYQNWCREVKLWRQAQVGANATQIIAKIVATLPINSRMGVLAYLENTENAPHTRSVDKVIEILNHRFGRTDTERALSSLSSFTEFKREGPEIIKISGRDSHGVLSGCMRMVWL